MWPLCGGLFCPISSIGSTGRRHAASRARLWASTQKSTMSQHEDFVPRAAPPPPPPPSSTSPQVISAPVFSDPVHVQVHQAPQISPLRRLAVQPPRLRTVALAPPQQGAHQSHTPASASNLNLPYSPFAASTPSAYAPSPLPPPSPMAMRNTSVPYNPQQWGRNGPMSGQYAPHPAAQTAARTHDMTGMEGNLPCFLISLSICSISFNSGSNSTSSLSLNVLSILVSSPTKYA